MSFEDLGLSPDTLRAVVDAGYTIPTPIQEQAIPMVLMGRDVMGIAQTGTGKTAGFTLPMIEILAGGRARARMPRSLILAPTRELAAQVADNFVKYGKYHKLEMALLIGGESMGDQEKTLERGVDVLIATPGRLMDHFERGRIILNDVKILVIDEADRMLDMGFIPDVEKIVSLLPKIRQTLFFSATMNAEIRRLADKFLMNPKEIQATPPATTASTVVQAIVTVRPADKRECLRRLIRAEHLENAFVFCNRKKEVDVLFQSLIKHGFNAVMLHGDMPQSKRMEMLAKFKAGEADLLVCSDVAARGLDITGVSHVINFDVPFNAEDYVHRIGRTGRAGRQGHAVTIATPAEIKSVQAIERLIKGPIPVLQEAAIADLALTGAEAAADDGEDHRRGRGRKRSDRPRRDDRAPRAERAPRRDPVHAEPAPVALAMQPEPDADLPEPDHAPEPPRERPRARRSREPRAEREPREPRAEREPREPRSDVIGFGDSVPAFLQIVPRVAPLPPADSEFDETADDAA
ncbi:MAG: DEAD/DEAH box helicase [Rhodospirillaceae bacterium]|nr:DEAD/DEAH box helicase [Rhodospirillaceae bacterium]